MAIVLKNSDALDTNTGIIKDVSDVIGASRIVSEAADPFHQVDRDDHSIYDDGPTNGNGGEASTLTFHQDFTQLLLSTAAIVGPTLSMTRDTQAMYSPAQSPGQIQRAPHQLLENANLSSRTAGVPSGWADGNDATNISYDDSAGYGEATFNPTAATQFITNTITTFGAETATAYFYIVSATNAATETIFSVTGAGANGDITTADINTLGGNTGWYAFAFTADASFTLNFGVITSGTETIVASRPALILGNPLGVAINVPVYCGTTPPLGAWVATDDGDEPKEDQARLASGVYDGSPENTCLWSEDMGNTGSWTVSNITVARGEEDPNSDFLAQKLTAGAANSTILQTISGGADYYSVYLKRDTGTGDVEITQDGGSNWVDITSEINSSTFTRVDTNGQTTSSVGIRIVTSGDAVVAYGNQNETTASPSTYMKSTNIPGKHMLETGVLIEEARTNLIVNSTDFEANDWTITASATVTSFDALGPDAVISGAATYLSSADGSQLQTTIVDTNDNAAFSIFAKDVDGEFLRMQLLADGTDGAEGTWNLASGVAVTAFAEGGGKVLSNEVENYGNGWYRCSIVASGVADTDWDVNLFIATDADSSAEAANESILIFGAQFEGNTTFITSYIETSGASVTRNQDLLDTSDVSWYDRSDISYVTEEFSPNLESQTGYLLHLNAGADADRIAIRKGASNTWSFNHNTTTGDDGLVNGGAVTAGVLEKQAMAVATNDMVGYLNAEQIGTDSLVTVPPSATHTDLDVGARFNGTSNLGSTYLKDLKSYNERRSNATLETDSLPLPLVGWDFTQATLAASSLTGDNVQSTGGTPVLISSRNDTDATFFNSSGVLTTVSNANDARVSSHLYNGTAWVNHGVLLEEQRTNLQIRSEELENAAWNAVRVTVTADQIVAPDGNTTADLFTEDTSDNNHRIRDNITLAVDTDAAFSVFAKAGTRDFVCVSYRGANENHVSAVFDISSSSTETAATETDVGTTSGTIASTNQEDVGNGWFRITLVGQQAGSNGEFRLQGAEFATGNTFTNEGSPAYLGTSETWYMWGAQAEAGAFPTSYIPTTSGTVTRNADQLLTDEVWWYNDTQGSWFVEATYPNDVGGNDELWGLTLSGNANRHVFRVNDPDQCIYIVTNSADDDALAASVGSITYGTEFKVATAYADDDANISLNGETTVQDNTVGLPLGARPTRLVFGNQSHGSAADAAHYIKTFEYRPLRLADSVLESQST